MQVLTMLVGCAAERVECATGCRDGCLLRLDADRRGRTTKFENRVRDCEIRCRLPVFVSPPRGGMILVPVAGANAIA